MKHSALVLLGLIACSWLQCVRAAETRVDVSPSLHGGGSLA